MHALSRCCCSNDSSQQPCERSFWESKKEAADRGFFSQVTVKHRIPCALYPGRDDSHCKLLYDMHCICIFHILSSWALALDEQSLLLWRLMLVYSLEVASSFGKTCVAAGSPHLPTANHSVKIPISDVILCQPLAKTTLLVFKSLVGGRKNIRIPYTIVYRLFKPECPKSRTKYLGPV